MARKRTIEQLSTAWNTEGREHFTEYSALLARLYKGEDVEVDAEDPRTEAEGDAVIKAIIDLNKRGEWQKARALFDPAYAPVFRWIKTNESPVSFATILGPDDVLVRFGTAWDRKPTTYHLKGGTAKPVADVRGMNRSRNREHLVLARAAGLTFHDGHAGIGGLRKPRAKLPWPKMSILMPRGLTEEHQARWKTKETALAVEQLQISDDGMRVVVSCYRQGILLASRHRSEPAWRLLLPDARDREEDAGIPIAGDMTHVAISRDGKRLAWGHQDSAHYLAEIGKGGEPRRYATVGTASEYPHDACFSDDGRYVSLNSCHFYQGATRAFDWKGNRGKRIPGYKPSRAAPVIDSSLRVYASCWLPKPGAFLLAGAGVMRAVTVKGKIVFVQGFGSSGASIDFCPESKRLAVGSYSGFLHLYDPYEEEEPGRVDGFHARREVARWAFWRRLPNGPIRW